MDSQPFQSRVAPAYFAAFLFLFVIVAGSFEPGRGFTRFIRFAEPWFSHHMPAIDENSVVVIPRSSGYDGQFYAQLALDPTLRDPDLKIAVDSPPYRARRILLPALAALAGFGVPGVVIQIYAFANVIVWIAFALLLLRWTHNARHPWKSFARWFCCCFALGTLDSIRCALTDLPSTFLLMVAIYCLENGRRTGSLISFGAAVLTREVSAIGGVIFAWPLPRNFRDIVKIGTLFTISILPAVAWFAYVRVTLGSTGSSTLNFDYPFFSAAKQVAISGEAILHATSDNRHVWTIVGMAGLFSQVGVLAMVRQPASAWWRIGAIYGLLLLLLGPAVWAGYWAVCRTVLPLTLAANLLLPIRGKFFWPVLLFSNLSLFYGIYRLLNVPSWLA